MSKTYHFMGRDKSEEGSAFTVATISVVPLTVSHIVRCHEELQRLMHEDIARIFGGEYLYGLPSSVPILPTKVEPKKRWTYSGKHPLDAWETTT